MPTPWIIDDSNWQSFVNPVIDGVPRATGLIPRNYATHPQGCYAWAPPWPAALTLPETQWPALLAAQQASKASLFDLRVYKTPDLDSLDQNGYGLSHSADTEVLTAKGWVPWPEYNGTDLLATVNPATHLLEFQAPLECHGNPYDGLIYASTNRRLDFAVTNYHRMYVRKWDEARRTLSDRYSFVLAKDLGWYAGFLAAPSGFLGTELVEVEVPGDRAYDGDDFLSLLSIVCSCGYAGGSESTRNWVSFCCFRDDQYATLDALARRVGFHENPGRKGVWTRYDAGALAEWVRQNCYTGPPHKAAEKKVPELVKWSSQRQIKVFLATFGDQKHNPEGNRQFYSTSKRMIDDVQELHLRVGKRSTISYREGRESHFSFPGKEAYVSQSKGEYTLTVAQKDRLCIDRKKHIETDHYKDLVYCATVPNGTLLTRRNGSVLISGNCWAFSSTKAAMYMRARANETDVKLSAWWVAGKVKGWADQGGWGAESTGEIATAGVPSYDLCPAYKSSYDTPDTQANAALHRTLLWYDGSQDRDANRAIMISAFLLGLAPVLDFNWLSHSMCGCRVVSLNPLTIDCDNSWGMNAGNQGLYQITGDKAIPDGVCVPMVTMPSAA
jgi:hypothetical protein